MERKDLAVKKVHNLNLRDEAARVTLRAVRQKGHVYVELRKISKRSIFFCTLCLTQCFSESVLFDHLRGNLHSRRYNSAKITLLLPNPWPFNDGVFFFDILREIEPIIVLASGSRRDIDGGSRDLADVNGVTSKFRGTIDEDLIELTSNRTGHKEIKKCKGVQEYFSISNVLPNDEISNFELKIIGYGHIGAKICEDSEDKSIFSRIWCAWLGDGNSDGCDELLASPKCDFAIVSFSYTYVLGKKSAHDENRPASPGFFFEIDDSGRRTKKRKKSFSDPEDRSEVVADRDLVQKLRKKNCFISRRRCDICGQPLLLGKDVATLLNLKNGRFLCSSRNINGAFHLFHVSCLIHWVLLCEFELWTNQPMNRKGTRGRKGKASVNKNLISSILCPECLGTGIHIEGDAIEKTTLSLSAAFRYKSKALDAHKAWMKSPENLQKCSTGLCFPFKCTDKLQENVSPTKLLLFYRVGE